jgi:hypothetical protein
LKTSRHSVTALTRLLWLEQLAQTIDEAQQLAWRVGVEEGSCPQAMDLYVQLEAARGEVDSLRRAFRLLPVRFEPVLAQEIEESELP